MTDTAVQSAPGRQGTGRASSAAISLGGLRKSFGPVQAVRGIDLEVQPGEVVAFLGPNGAGKTSTIDMILGLSKPTSGDVSVFGMDPEQAIGHGLVAAVMQTGGLLKDFTVGETATFTSKLFAHTRPVAEVLERAGGGRPVQGDDPRLAREQPERCGKQPVNVDEIGRPGGTA